jgi:pimeloyl-ACP methyl ester carboxylesterase
MANFVLVHGAWHGAWCWHKLVDQLEAAGHIVVAADLPGHGGDPTPPEGIDLGTYSDFVCDLIDSVPDEVLLVGHSLGGLTITQVAEQRPDRLRSLVYLAAFVPEPGSTFDAQQDLTTEACLAAVQLAQDGNVLLFDPDSARDVFYADCSEQDLAFARQRLCGEPAGATRSTVEISDEGWGRVPRDYIVCLQDRALDSRGQRALAERRGCRNVYTLDTSHSPFFSAPAELAKILGQIAES